MSDKALEQRLEELESRLAFQDDLLERLDGVVIHQGQALDRLALKIDRLSEQIAMLESDGGGRSAPEDEVPPHY